MRQDFFKIVSSEFVDDLLNGILYMNPLSYFRKIEKGDNPAQKDPLEGSLGTVSKNQLRQYGLHYSDSVLKMMGDQVNLISENYGFQNLYCLYQLQINDEVKTVLKPSSDLVNFNDPGEASKVVVWIKNQSEFLARLERAIQQEIKTYQQEYAIYGSVVYRNSWLSADAPGNRCAFHKEPSFAYQQEWRLAILRCGLKDEAYRFSIGNLRDIVTVIPLKDFIEHPEILYPGYALVTEADSNSFHSYRMFGQIHAVSKLMYAYEPQHFHQPEMSDQALADWHYTQYLHLSGHDEQIEAYLEKVFESHRDLEHLHLLAQYRLSKDLWIKAVDAYHEILTDDPEIILEDPNSFFYSLHQILMTHQQPADAAKLIKISEQYNLSVDLRTTMLSDCLFALGEYDQVVEIYKKMQNTFQDPILDYYLAVSYLSLLQFSMAEKHLIRYKNLFSQSQASAKKAEELNKILACFLNNEPLLCTTKRHPFQGLNWEDKIEDTLKMAEGKTLYLGIDALCQLEIGQKWDLLQNINLVEVVPQTIARLLDIYSSTGNLLFYKIIQHLSQMEHLRIRSPKLEYFLLLDCQYPDWPNYYKAERGLQLEERTT